MTDSLSIEGRERSERFHSVRVTLLARRVGRPSRQPLDFLGSNAGRHRAQGVIVKPEERGRHLRRLVRVQHALRFAESEPVRRDSRVAVAVAGDAR